MGSQQIQASKSKPIQEEYKVQAFTSYQRCNTSFQSTAYQQERRNMALRIIYPAYQPMDLSPRSLFGDMGCTFQPLMRKRRRVVSPDSGLVRNFSPLATPPPISLMVFRAGF